MANNIVRTLLRGGYVRFSTRPSRKRVLSRSSSKYRGLGNVKNNLEYPARDMHFVRYIRFASDIRLTASDIHGKP